ncbi:NPCBM/NEW2 domain-containing protein [Streptomyces sp. NBC_01362]|uniref:NPCBM/NEW2 domain-containing protein n=1 Tax=Streptomyces sp. NBC_01362 TaxID=2903839 RepID=UPI002E321300|nr:NPCBM/NEW2 domain-containing protein [Streptomyces sp. NBC_01362]
MSSATPPDDGAPPPPPPSRPPSPPDPGPPTPPPAPTPRPRRVGEIAALVSAITAVVGLLLGFFGLPTVVNSPTAKTVTVTETVTATATATVEASPREPADEDPAQSPAPAPLPSGEVALSDLTPLGDYPDDEFGLQTVTLGGKSYSNAMVVKYPCQPGTEYSINQRYKKLVLTVGLDDNAVAVSGKLAVIGDRKTRKNIMLEVNRPQTVTVDITGVVKLGIEADISDDSSCNDDGVVVALGKAVLMS